jgi:hypothetical protein
MFIKEILGAKTLQLSGVRLVLNFPAASKVQLMRGQSGVANPSIFNRAI